jgi:hypothetical protein
VLVDPVLREAAVARLPPAHDVFRPPLRTAPRVLRPELPLREAEAPTGAPAPSRRSGWRPIRLAPALVPLGLAFGVMVAIAASEMRSDGPLLATAPTHTATAPARQSSRPPFSPTPGGRTVAQASPRAVERELLELVVRAPEGKLPRALIDPASGLARNGLQAVCRSSRPAGSFFCVIRSSASPTTRVYVRYRRDKDGRGSFTWLPRPRG